MSNQERTLERPFIALDIDGEGAHPAAAVWKGTTPQEAHPGRRLARRALAAEESAGFHALVLAEPFHLAMQLMTLDHNSLGRAGWLVHGARAATEAGSVGRETPDDARVRREIVDGIEVNRRLWDSWEDNAEIRDVATGRFIDADRIHHIDFEGEHYSVKSAAIVPRSPQGQIPVIAPAGLVDAGADVDVVQVTADTVDALVDAVRDARARGFRRVIAEMAVAVDALGVPAARRITHLDREAAWDPGALVTGSAGQVTDEIARVLDVDLPELSEDVLPALRDRLPLADNPAGATFRALLGLSRPVSRYATTQPTQEENR